MTMRKILFFLIIIYTVTLYADNQNLNTEVYDVAKAIKLYSLNYQPTQFLTMNTLSTISNKLNFAKAEKSFAQYTNTIFELNVFFKTIGTSNLNINQQMDIIQSLSLLYKKMLSLDDIGVGNIELSLYIRQFISGMFFNIISIATEEEQEKVVHSVIDQACLNSEEYIEKILTCNELNTLLGFETQNNIPSLIYQIIEFDDAQQNKDLTPFFVLNEQLKKHGNVNYPDFNKYQFASFLIQSYRSVLMCRLPDYINQVISMNLMSVKEKNEMLFKLCEKNFSHDELNMLYFYYGGDDIERVYKLRNEVKSSISNKGKPFIMPVVLRMSNR